MKTKELRQKTPKDLDKEIIEAKKELLNLRFQATNGQLENTARVKQVRRNVARLKTIQNELIRAKSLKKAS